MQDHGSFLLPATSVEAQTAPGPVDSEPRWMGPPEMLGLTGVWPCSGPASQGAAGLQLQ